MDEKKRVLYTRAAKVALPVAILVYAAGLWPVCPTLSEKGYYIALLALGLFSVVVYSHLTRRQCLSALINTWCQLMLLTSMGLLVVGLWNEPIPFNQKIIYFIAWMVSLVAMIFCLNMSQPADAKTQ